jgi:hypothetical protein
MGRTGAGLAVAVFLAAGTSQAAIIKTQSQSTPHPGVTVIEGTTRAPSSHFYATKVSLCTPGVKVAATPNASTLQTVPKFAAASGADVAINGDFYKAGPRVYGIAVGNGGAWPIKKTGADPAVADQWYYNNFGWIAFGPNFVEFTHTEYVKKNVPSATGGYSPGSVVSTFPEGTVSLVSGFPELVTEGTRHSCPDPTAATCFPDRADMHTRNPRSAMGLTQDRRTFILAVVDGRTAGNAGMYGTELAELMEELGAWQAFNLDGGGSSEMWIRGRGTVNKPADGASRTVANHWGILTGEGDSAAHCIPVAAPDAGVPVADTRHVGGTNLENPAAGDDVEPAEGGCNTSASTHLSFGGIVLSVAMVLLARRRRRD